MSVSSKIEVRAHAHFWTDALVHYERPLASIGFRAKYTPFPLILFQGRAATANYMTDDPLLYSPVQAIETGIRSS